MCRERVDDAAWQPTDYQTSARLPQGTSTRFAARENQLECEPNEMKKSALARLSGEGSGLAHGSTIWQCPETEVGTVGKTDARRRRACHQRSKTARRSQCPTYQGGFFVVAYTLYCGLVIVCQSGNLAFRRCHVLALQR